MLEYLLGQMYMMSDVLPFLRQRSGSQVDVIIYFALLWNREYNSKKAL